MLKPNDNKVEIQWDIGCALGKIAFELAENFDYRFLRVDISF